MTWMNMWSGGFPLYLGPRDRQPRRPTSTGTRTSTSRSATRARWPATPPQPTVAAVQRRAGDLGGITTMLPTADAQWVGAELARRFGMPLWSFTLSATDANRWAIRLARLATGRPKVLVFAYCYHGSVDEAFALRGPDGKARAARATSRPPVDLDLTTRVATWNDLADVEAALAHGDVAVILDRAGPHQHRDRARPSPASSKGCAGSRRRTARSCSSTRRTPSRPAIR